MPFPEKGPMMTPGAVGGFSLAELSVLELRSKDLGRPLNPAEVSEVAQFMFLEHRLRLYQLCLMPAKDLGVLRVNHEQLAELERCFQS